MDYFQRLTILIRSLFALVLFSGASLSFAQSVYWSEGSGGTGRTSTDAIALCQTMHPTVNIVRVDPYGPAYSCVYHQPPNSYYYIGTLYRNTCQTGTAFINGSCQAPAQCLSNQELDPLTNTCKCKEGVEFTGSASGDILMTCHQGCSALIIRGYYDKVANKTYGIFRQTFATSSCTPTTSSPAADTSFTEKQEAERCPAGQCPGTVNGTSLCVPCSNTKQTTDTTTNTSTTNTNTSGQSTTTSTNQNTQKQTSCTGDKCTTTTTTTTKNPDGTTKAETTTQEQPKQDYCKENPNAPACKGSVWGGTCGQFVCDGDAVQCATAQAVWKQNCEMQVDTTNPVFGQGTSAINGGDIPSDHPLAPGNIRTIDISEDLSDASIFATRECISDKQVQFMDKSYTLPLSKLCTYLEMLGNGFLASCFLAAAFIVFRK